MLYQSIMKLMIMQIKHQDQDRLVFVFQESASITTISTTKSADVNVGAPLSFAQDQNGSISKHADVNAVSQ